MVRFSPSSVSLWVRLAQFIGTHPRHEPGQPGDHSSAQVWSDVPAPVPDDVLVASTRQPTFVIPSLEGLDIRDPMMAPRPQVAPKEALRKLSDGNARFASGEALHPPGAKDPVAGFSAYHGFPWASILGCVDSSVPLEALFDTQPGELDVLRNLGSALDDTGGVVDDLEYSINSCGVRLILVVGSSAETALDSRRTSSASVLKTMSDDVGLGLGPVEHLRGEVAPRAAHESVYAAVEDLLMTSETIRENVKEGKVQIHCAVYDAAKKKVKFLGEHPRLRMILGVSDTLQHAYARLQDYDEGSRPGLERRAPAHQQDAA